MLLPMSCCGSVCIWSLTQKYQRITIRQSDSSGSDLFFMQYCPGSPDKWICQTVVIDMIAQDNPVQKIGGAFKDPRAQTC